MAASPRRVSYGEAPHTWHRDSSAAKTAATRSYSSSVTPASRRRQSLSGAADQIDKTPHVAAWVAARWRAISCVLLVQAHRAFPRLVVALSECAQGTLSKSLGTAEKLCGTALRCLALKVCIPVLEMKDEPELYAWVRDSQFDLVPVREVDRLRKVWMLITVEDAPDLIVGPSPPSLLLSSFYSLCLNSMLDQLQGATPIGIDLDQYSVAVPAAPVCEI